MYIIMDVRLRRILTIVDENKHNMPEGEYIEICNNLNEIRKINSREKIQRRVNRVIKFTKYLGFMKFISVFLNTFNKKIFKK